MIRIPLQAGFLLYILVMLGLLGIVSAYEMVRRNTQEWTPSEKPLAYCTDCGRTFLVERGSARGRCPRCGAPCRAGGTKKS